MFDNCFPTGILVGNCSYFSCTLTYNWSFPQFQCTIIVFLFRQKTKVIQWVCHGHVPSPCWSRCRTESGVTHANTASSWCATSTECARRRPAHRSAAVTCGRTCSRRCPSLSQTCFSPSSGTGLSKQGTQSDIHSGSCRSSSFFFFFPPVSYLFFLFIAIACILLLHHSSSYVISIIV